MERVAEVFRYNRSLQTEANSTGGKKFPVAAAPEVGEDGWEKMPIPYTPAVAKTEISRSVAEMSKALDAAEARGLAKGEEKAEEAYRLGKVGMERHAEAVRELEGELKAVKDQLAPFLATQGKTYADGYKEGKAESQMAPEGRAKAYEEGYQAAMLKSEEKIAEAVKAARAELVETKEQLAHGDKAIADMEDLYNQSQEEVKKLKTKSKKKGKRHAA